MFNTCSFQVNSAGDRIAGRYISFRPHSNCIIVGLARQRQRCTLVTVWTKHLPAGFSRLISQPLATARAAKVRYAAVAAKSDGDKPADD